MAYASKAELLLLGSGGRGYVNCIPGARVFSHANTLKELLTKCLLTLTTFFKLHHQPPGNRVTLPNNGIILEPLGEAKKALRGLYPPSFPFSPVAETSASSSPSGCDGLH